MNAGHDRSVIAMQDFFVIRRRGRTESGTALGEVRSRRLRLIRDGHSI